MNTWRAVVLAASRGAEDPMAKAFGILHKCALPIAGKPMLHWVVTALEQSMVQQPIAIVIDNQAVAVEALKGHDSFELLHPAASAPASAIQAINQLNTFPVLLTTGDHPLLTPAMINFFVTQADQSQADVLVGLATDSVITPAYPTTKRTYFNLGGTRVSGCNLFAVRTAAGMKLLEAWQHLEKNRKNPLKLVGSFGLAPLFWYAIAKLTPARAFSLVSNRLGIVVKPVFMPFAEAAMDVDKPSDHAIAESILRKRSVPA